MDRIARPNGLGLVPQNTSGSKILTLGYSNLAKHEFLDVLKENSVEFVVDVRLSPYSRKPGFSKAILAEGLADHGIDYQWLPQLGVPKFMRDELAETGDWVEFESRYREILDAQSDALWRLAFKARQKVTCLICLEADPAECHRTFVASVLRERYLIGGICHLDPHSHRRRQINSTQSTAIAQ